MADIVDDANDHMERWLQGRLEEHAHQLNQMGNEPEEESRCRNCQEPLPQGQHYCSFDCAQDFAHRQRMESRQWRYR